MSRGRSDAAMKYFRTSARVNRKHLPSDVRITLSQQPVSASSAGVLINAVISPYLRQVTEEQNGKMKRIKIKNESMQRMEEK